MKKKPTRSGLFCQYFRMAVVHYYNDNDKYVAKWLRNLVSAGKLPAGHVDERSIVEVCADDIKEYTQCHFFTGIGGWPLALQLAGVSAETRLWTGSCPCQPFSNAGQRKGEEDERHLWPEFLRLISECSPPVVFGEQVSGPDGRIWLSGVRRDMEALGYAFGAADLCGPCVGAPHARQRLFWVGYADGERLDFKRPVWERAIKAGRPGETLGQEHPDGERRQEQCVRVPDAAELASPELSSRPWDNFEVIGFRDGTRRRIKPGTVPLAPGVPGRVARIRAIGNAIIPQVAAEFIEAFFEYTQNVSHKILK